MIIEKHTRALAPGLPATYRTELRANPALAERLEATKRFRKAVEHPVNIEITARCNLRCEGCYFYEGDAWTAVEEAEEEVRWARFFEMHKARGTKFAFIHGAEPGLVQDRLVMASRAIPRGAINTNGTIPIRPEVTLPLHVSIWGDDATEKKFRGGAIFTKIMRRFSGDRRVRFVFTVHRANIGQIDGAARAVRDAGGKLFFNYFSPTGRYIDKLDRGTKNDDQYFRVSTPHDNLLWDEGSRVEARAAIDAVIDAYPDTVWHSKAFNKAMLKRDSWFVIDANGIAVNCLSRNLPEHPIYGVNAEPSEAKCSTPNIDCRSCKVYPALWSIMRQPGHFLADEDATLEAWLDIVRHTSRLFTTEDDPAFIA